MTTITADLVKKLRETSGAGMMDCKKALTENGGDFEAAMDWLRKKGLSAAAKKAGRTASDGLVAIAIDGKRAALVELNSETDFVAKNDKFQDLIRNIASYALQAKGNVEADINVLKSFVCPKAGKKVEEVVTENIAIIGENLNLRRAAIVSVNQGIISTYIHNAVAPNLGKIGVLVALESSADASKLAELGKQLALHIAANKPEALTTADVDKDKLDRERAIYADQARASGKPENIIEKMVEGRVRKYYAQVVLLEQPFVMDDKITISQLLESAAKSLGAPVKISRFVCFTLGEGIEKEEKNFAEEVAAAVANG